MSPKQKTLDSFKMTQNSESRKNISQTNFNNKRQQSGIGTGTQAMRRSLNNYNKNPSQWTPGMGGGNGPKSSYSASNHQVPMKSMPRRAPLPPKRQQQQLRAEDISKLFGTQDNFNMLKGLLNQSGAGGLNAVIKSQQQQQAAAQNSSPVKAIANAAGKTRQENLKFAGGPPPKHPYSYEPTPHAK